MSFCQKIFTGFVYRKNIVKHIAYNNIESANCIINNVIKSDYCTNITGRECDSNHFSKGDPFVRFDSLIEERRNLAQRSCVVQVNSENSCPELYAYCQNFSTVDKMYYYQVKGDHFVLVEFGNKVALDTLHFGLNNYTVVSPFVWFRSGNKVKLQNSDVKWPFSSYISTQVPTNSQIIEWMSTSQSLLDEMEVLYQATKLSDLGIKLRMICAWQIEMMLSGLFPNIKAIPFGSTVNSFGKGGCDLDVVLRYTFSQVKSEDTRLVYQSKMNSVSSRGQIQRQMEVIGDLLQIFVPGVIGVKRILGARVPIIKYSHDYAGVDIDISLTNMSAVYMSELLYLFAYMDPAAQRIVFAIKTWAKAIGLTNPTPGRWITNFSLTLLAIFYLQIEKRLPSVDDLFRLAGEDDKRYAEDINCSFIRDVKNIKLDFDQSKSPAELLIGFFNYYQNFEFNSKGISLCTAKLINKPDYSPLYIVNPLERNLNVSKNVSSDELERFRIGTRNAAWTLENGSRFCEILRSPETSLSKRKYVPRMLVVKDLFQS